MPKKNTKEKIIEQKITDYKNFVIDSVNISFGKLVILENTALTIRYGQHYALLGKNGIGKTSLLNAIVSRTIPVPEKLDIIYVRQEEPESDLSVLDTLLAADEIMYANSKRLAELEEKIMLENETTSMDDNILEEYNLLSQFVGSEHIKSKIRAKKILFGLGFTEEEQLRKVSVYSGGWRMRISLAKALFITPTMLILDEPTNHLDLYANIWLTEYLKTYPKTIIVVSHDKFFIDETCATIIHIHDKKLNYYHGDYAQFQKQFAIEQQKKQKEWILFQKKIVSLRKSKKSPTEIEEFISLSKLTKPEKNYVVKINFLEPNIIKGNFVSMENITFGYDNNNTIFENLFLEINNGTRMAIVGKNGSGKTTLLKILLGDLKPTCGEIIRSSILRIGYYNQHFEESMSLNKNPVTYLMDLNPNIDITLAHKYLSMFGLEPCYHSTKISELSGGQKARAKFASFGVIKPHLLILDEPSNHLDMITIDSLINALNSYGGALILITHNFDIITRLNSELWIVENKKISKYSAGYEKYIQKVCNEYD